MITAHALPKSEPLLIGPLRMHRFGRVKGRPVLAREAWCPWCRDRHVVTWPDPPFNLEGVQPLDAPCRTASFPGREVMGGLDPDRHPEHARLIQHFDQAIRRWRSEQRLRRQFAEAREVDRRHLAGWDVLPSPELHS